MKPFILSAFCIFIFIESSCTNIHKDAKPLKITDKGVNIAYTDNGKGDTTLLFVHGWCINKTYWTNQVKYFGDKYRVVTVDLPGFGESGKNRNEWTTEAFGRDIDSVMVQLNLKNVILVGHSMAGDIILQAAVNAPEGVIGLVGVDNFKNLGHVQTTQDKADYNHAIDSLKHHFRQITFEYFNQSLFYKTTTGQIRKRVLNDVANADTVIAAACMEENDFDEIKQLSAIKKKLYLINSDYTKTDTTGFKVNHIPYQVFIIHATGHFPMIEKPQEFNILLRQIISKI
ncbi:MAG: Pimeloyl-ACP methyl ester carboxylesterase [Mucilaginibacter sp.]|nr:Pimeloyl-ACP methyl ester carboxylesterase [Mucilaginibacter sp.]